MQTDSIIIGLSGSFGSGCSKLREVLEESYADEGYTIKGFKISDEIKAEAKKQGLPEDDRATLQDIGNEFRKNNGNGYWVKKIIAKIEGTTGDLFVVDGIRNLGEVQELRKYRKFFLVAVDCSTDNRWKRLDAEIYKGNRSAFEHDDERDKDEGLPYGQQVLSCVEEADIIFINEEQYDTDARIKDEIKNRFKDYLLLITGKQLRMPNTMETMMAVASNLALQSRCLKRRVGAVLCDSKGFIVSAAYNEVPYPAKSCYDEYRMCYRDFYRTEFKEKILSHFSDSKCSDEFSVPASFKALDKCRALHAEEVVILQTPKFQINGASLYTTTFPCMQCAKRIINADLKKVIYIDPYPEEEAIGMLEKAKVKTVKFGGVKAQAFYRFFYPYREWLEEQIKKKSKSS